MQILSFPRVITEPSEEPVSLAEAKAHLRVIGSEEDALISNLIKAAREKAEAQTARAFVTQTREVWLDRFPSDPVFLPSPPLLSIVSIKYLDSNLALQTVNPSVYRTIPNGQWFGTLQLVKGQAWPSDYQPGEYLDNVQVRYTCGYGAASAVPSAIKAAMLLSVGNWYENRESVITGTIATVLPDAAVDLLNSVYVGQYQ